jgi:hypothetical protein
MSSISHITKPPARRTLALGLIMVTMTMMVTVTTTTSIFLVPPLVQNALADHGQEVVLSVKESSFVPKSLGEEGNQLKVVVNYAVSDPMTVNDLAKAVMKVYSPDGTLVKTSSSPTPFRITNNPGTVTLATTLTDTTIEGVIAKIVFTNPIKTEAISNELPVSVDLIKGVTLSEEPQEDIIPEDLSRSDSSQDAPTNPPSEEINEEASIIQGNQQETSIESTPQTTNDNPPIPETTTGYASEQAPITQADQQETSIESTPQTTNDNPPIPETTTAPPIITRETCDDGIDNDGDILIDFSDRDCSTTQHQYQLRLQQEQTMGQTPEVCEDSLDNDLDGKIDNRDEECTTSSFSPSIETQSSQAQPSVEKETGEEDKVKEQQPDEDISEESGEREGDDDDEDEDSDQHPDDEDSDDDDDNNEEDE